MDSLTLKMSGGKITISPKYGANPSIVKCFVCGQDTGEVALLGRLGNKRKNEDLEAPKYIHEGLCKECTEKLKHYTACIVVRDGETGDNPYRTGDYFFTTRIPDKKNIVYIYESDFKKIKERYESSVE